MSKQLETNNTDAAPTATASAGLPFASAAGEYVIDAIERTVLFWDVLRRRANSYYEHKAKPVPHVLSFDAELVLDGRTLDRPANYLLVRIKPPADVVIDPRKRPFVVVDPRGGHGPGIGGFKADSELGVAMRAGHPAYFVGFTPDPMPGQTIEDIMRVEAAFLEKVIALHPDADGKPCVIGNCQAGWAVMMLAAVRPELFGPLINPGSPLSYWAGVHGKNPMRYTGGLLGGSWLTALVSDLGAGKFDSGYLVENFENLNPANTYWTKYYNLWAKIDSETERFLDFETWWGGHVNLNAEEMQWIVDELFIGNRLATAEITASDGVRVDLRNIRSPILCFCSKGDNITPPQQAVGWIIDLYEHDQDIKACGQTIVYAIHESIGHLGIFVSGGVARKEHDEFASNIDLIDVLPPGLYEAVMTPKVAATAGVELVHGDWVVRFEPRTLADVRAIVQPDPEDERRFAAVRQLSDINLGLYRTLLQPFVQAFVNERSAEALHQLQPSEMTNALFSDRNPLMRQIGQMAEQIREQRHARAADNPFVQLQEMVSSQIVAALDQWRDLRDHAQENLFLAIYGQPILQALLMLKGADQTPRSHPGLEPERLAFINQRIAEIRARIAEGGVREAAVRSLLYIGMAGPGADERAFEVLRQVRAEHGGGLSLGEFKAMVREQYFALLLDPKAALNAIPRMLPADPALRNEAAKAVRRVHRPSERPRVHERSGWRRSRTCSPPPLDDNAYNESPAIAQPFAPFCYLCADRVRGAPASSGRCDQVTF